MRALITASFDEGAKARLARHMEVVHEDWKVRKTIHFDGAAFAAHIRELGADVLIVEADLVHAEVLEGCPLTMIGCCRGDPVNIDLAMGQLFDFFADNPNVPKLLLRRIVENEEIDVGIERDILQPAWDVFSEWLARLGRRVFSADESRLFMLSVHSVLLAYLLDSRPYQSLLGGSVRSGRLREQVRRHVIQLVHRLLAA